MKKIVNIFASILLMFMVCQTVKAQEPATAIYTYEEVSFCHGGSVTYKGRVYTEQGKDTLKYQSSTGGDSLVVLTINEYPNYHFDQTVHIQQDSSYNWMGSTYSKTGTYTKAYTTVYGCDSIYTLNLIVDQAYAFHDSASVCLGEIYEWQGKKINEGAAGKYQYEVNYISQWGVDSTYYLTLIVLPIPHSQEVLVLCPGGHVTFMGKTYTQAGRDVIIVPSVTGCDSTIEVVIKANPNYHFNDTVHIKEGSTYTWHGETYDQTGTYELPFKTIEGCDSVYTLTLFVDPSYTVNQDTTVCFGESFKWNNLYINATEAGEKDYQVTLQSIYGTDSIINLHVTVLPRIVEYKQLYFCHGGGVTYNGHTYTQAGRDTLTYQSHLGCDSLLVLTIYENPSYQFFDTVYLAKGETITWHKQSITEFKTYTDSYESVHGCDSTYTLVVYEKPTYNFYQDTTICFGEAFEWHNQKISEEKAGTYTYTANYTSRFGTDSIYHLNLTILPKYWTIQQVFFCEGSKAYYGGKTYTQSGRDTLHYTSALGCDSIVEVIVNFKNPIYFKDTVQLEEGTTLEWRGQTISAAGTYKDEYGCDSIFTLFVQLVHVDHIYQNATICEGDTYAWEGQTYSATGDYIASYKNQAGNDSIMHLHLTVNPKSWVIKHFSLCQGGTIEYNGKTYHKAGRDTITFTSSLGCDSIEEVIVTETYPFHQYDTIKLEAGTTTEWHGQTISAGGTYKDENTTIAGCDSIYELYVQLYYVDHIYKDTTICYGETYTWQGVTYKEPGEYVREKRFTNQAGTDSIMHLHLVILPEYKIIKAFNLCKGSTIEYNGKTYTTAGRDTFYFTSSRGCDSIVEVIVTETYPFHQYDTIKLEAGTTTEWHGQTISVGGTYKDENTTVAGCDSIYELYVQLYYIDHIYKDTTICYGETYTWQGDTYKEPGEYIREKRFTNQAGTDSIMHLHLVILPENKTTQMLTFCHGKSVTFNGKTYTQPGRDTIYTTASTGCDSIIEVIITESPIYAFYDTITIWDTDTYTWHGQTITGSGEYTDEYVTASGCDSTYYLKVNVKHKDDIHETATICHGETYTWQGNTYGEVGTHHYEITYTNQYGNDSTMHLHLTVLPKYWKQLPMFFCHGSNVTFNGKTYSAEGKDTLRFNSVNGCDSIVELIIKEYPTYLYQDTVHIKSDSVITWHGMTIDREGTFEDRQYTINGCDSIYRLTVIEDVVYNFYEKASICTGQTLEWQGLTINRKTAGVYDYHRKYTSQLGTDSIYHLELTVTPSYFEQKQFNICPGSSVTFLGHVYTQSGRDTIQLFSSTGCDSLIEVIVAEYPDYHYEQTVHIKKDSSYTWKGKIFTQSGKYYESYSTIHGCDSIYTLNLIVDSAYTFHDTAVSCLGDVFEWQGLKISEAAAGQYNYKVNYATQYGMDSTYYLALTIREKPFSQQIISICPGENITFHNKSYSKAGRDTILLPSTNGCDSVIEVIINEYESYRFNDTVYIRKDSSYTWHGQQYSEAGHYVIQGSTIHGCDSSYTLTVIKVQDYEYWETAHSCVGETYYWQGLEINEKAAGTYEYTQKYVSQFSTDSIYHLTLTVDTAYVQYQYLSFCEGGFVIFGDSTYTQSGTDTLRFYGVGGCDSTIIVVINEQKRFFTSDTIELSNQETYLWHGQSISQSGTYRDVQTTASGCDSIYELVAFFYPTYLFEDSVAICQSEAPYIWKLNETTEIPLNHQVGLTKRYEQRYETVNHRDSIYRLILTILPEYEIDIAAEICEGDRYSFGNKTYDSTGTYTDTLQTIYGCDSIIHLHLNVTHKYLRVDTAFLSKSHPTYTWSINDSTFTTPTVFAINNKTIAGCDSINRLVLLQAQEYIFPIEHDTLCSSGHDAIIWHNKTLTESGIYYDSLFTVLGEDSIYSIELVVFPTYDTTISVTMCEVELPYLFNNRIECTKTGTYLDTLHTIHGCDSVVRLELNVLPRVIEATTDIICEADLAAGYYFHGMRIINEGMYAVPLQSDTHCNSVAELFLRLKPDLMESDSVVICAGDTYVLGRAHDPEISEEYNGITVSPMKDTIIWGCDNIHYFKIFVRNEKDTTVNMCENDSLWLPGTKRWVYAVPNAVYIDTIKTNPDLFTTNPDSVLCDSIVRWTIGDIYPTYHPDTVVMHISDHDSILWGGKYRTAAGIYDDTTKTVGCGCDSIVTLRLIVDKTYSFRDSIHICQPHDVAYQHEWTDGHIQSQAIWNEGIYIDSLRSSATADLYQYYPRDYKDSIYTLIVTMDSSYFFQHEYTLCQGDSVQLAGQWITKPGVYTDSLKTAKGCDSIYQYVVNMTQSYYYRENKSIPQGTIIKWHNRDLEIPGVYYDSLKTVTGCDSIYELTLNVYPTYHYILDTTICACQTPFLWHEQMIYESGTYFDKHQTIHHFDSIYELRLQVKDTSHVRINASTCEGDSIFFDNKWIKQAGIYYDTLTNAFGCDSIIEFVYTQKREYLFEQTAQTDDQHPYIWAGHKDEEGNDMIFTTSGLYQDKRKTIDGCDSIYRLNLTVYPTYHFDTLKQTICASEAPYYWAEGQRDCANSGIYTARYSTVNGYDSIYVLNLTVLSTSYGTERLMICEGDSAVYNGHTYKTQGTFYDTLTSPITGCDSIVSVIVTITPKYYFKESAQTDDQHPYTWMEHKGNIVYNHTGVYYDSLKTVTGCDSIYELTLTVYPSYHFDTLKQTICASEAPYYWAEGQRACANSGIYTARYSTVNGYDSIYVLNLTVLSTSYGTERLMICEGDSAVYNGHTYKTQGTFYDTLTSPITGCDSIVSVIVTITPKYYFKESAQTDDQHPYTWMEHKGNIVYNRTGIYYDSLKTVTGCDSIYELTLTVYPSYHFDTLKQTICASEAPYYWSEGQRDCANSGIYTARYSTVNGYDSIYVLDLTVNPTLHGEMSVSICEGDSFPWNGKQLTKGGNYVDTLYSPTTGCDSIVTLHLFIKKTYFIQHNQTIYAGDTVFFEGDTLLYGGLYEKRYQSSDSAHCDSIIQLNLVVKPTYYRDTIVTICESELPYRWNWHNDEAFYTGGKYVRTSITEEARFCDTLYLNVDERHIKTIQTFICEGDSLRYRNKIYKTSGTFYDTIPTPEGCDSIYKIVIGVYPNSTQYLTVHISEKEKYSFGQTTVDTIWNAEHTSYTLDTIHTTRILDKSGTYYDYNKNMFGCDSVTILTLVVHPSIKDSLYTEVCDNELPFTFGGRKLWKSGLYTDSLYTREGYDSIVILNLKVQPTYLLEEIYEIKEGTHTFIHGKDISNEGIYYDSLKTKSGCDSIYKIVVNFKRVWRQEYDVTICQGEVFDFYGAQYTKEGTYRYTSPTEDSIVIAHLTVNETKFTRFEKLLCSDGDSLYFYHGNELKAPIIFRDTFKTTEGCDSIVILDLKITEKFSEWDERPLCKGDTVIIQGDTIFNPGDYELLRKSKSGKNDSIYRVSFYEAPNFEVSVVDTICQGDTLWVGSIPVTRAGKQTLNPKTVDGCDSIVHLNLVVNPSYFIQHNATIVDYQSYQWRGKSYSESGTYYDILPTIDNCDSTFALELKVIPTYRIPEDREICAGDTTRWRGKEYSEPGFYTDTVCNIPSYTSIIYTLNLSIAVPTEILSATVLTQEICADAREMVLNVQHTGATPQTYSVYFDARARHEGFVDIKEASFITPGTIIVPLPELDVNTYENGMNYVRPDNYTITVELNNGVCGVSKSKPVEFQVRYPYNILDQNWNNVVAVLAKDYNGGFEFNQYSWRINNLPVEGTEAFIRNDFLAEGDSVVAYLTRVGEDYSIPTCPLIISAPAPDVYPTPVLHIEPSSAPVTSPRFVIKSQMGGDYSIYTMMGQPLGQGKFEQGTHELMLPALVGHYVIYVSQEDGTKKAQHVIVY